MRVCQNKYPIVGKKIIASWLPEPIVLGTVMSVTIGCALECRYCPTDRRVFYLQQFYSEWNPTRGAFYADRVHRAPNEVLAYGYCYSLFSNGIELTLIKGNEEDK